MKARMDPLTKLITYQKLVRDARSHYDLTFPEHVILSWFADLIIGYAREWIEAPVNFIMSGGKLSFGSGITEVVGLSGVMSDRCLRDCLKSLVAKGALNSTEPNRFVLGDLFYKEGDVGIKELQGKVDGVLAKHEAKAKKDRAVGVDQAKKALEATFKLAMADAGYDRTTLDGFPFGATKRYGKMTEKEFEAVKDDLDYAIRNWPMIMSRQFGHWKVKLPPAVPDFGFWYRHPTEFAAAYNEHRSFSDMGKQTELDRLMKSGMSAEEAAFQMGKEAALKERAPDLQKASVVQLDQIRKEKEKLRQREQELFAKQQEVERARQDAILGNTPPPGRPIAEKPAAGGFVRRAVVIDDDSLSEMA